MCSVEAVSAQTLFHLRHLHADSSHCVATQAEGMTYCGECRNFPSFMLLSAAGLTGVLDYSIFIEMLILILG